jgi:hypothetical protein
MPEPTADLSSLAAASLIGVENNQFHTRLLRVSLALEESRAYWHHWQPHQPREKQALAAFEARWFGSKSLERVQALLAAFHHRYDVYPAPLTVLAHWQPSDPVTRQTIVHWHTQLSDPLYRAFTGDFLEQRRLQANPTIDRDLLGRWLVQQVPTTWAAATSQRMAMALITCAAAAGLCTTTTGSRRLTYPQVTDQALTYWLYILRHLDFQGTLLDNPYLASVGLKNGFLEQRLRKLPGLMFNRMAELYEFDWHYPDLKSWAMGELDLPGGARP